jgi:hypothetical protein
VHCPKLLQEGRQAARDRRGLLTSRKESGRVWRWAADSWAAEVGRPTGDRRLLGWVLTREAKMVGCL